jgi:hypothetical protein
LLVPSGVSRPARPAFVGYFFVCPFPATGKRLLLFLFFSNRLGCAGSLLVSLAVTVVLLLLLGVIQTH